MTGLLLVIIGGLEVAERLAPKAIIRLKKYREQLIETKAVLHEIKELKQTISQMQADVNSIHDTKACLEIKDLLEKHLASVGTQSAKKIDPDFISKVIYQFGADIKSIKNEIDLIKQAREESKTIVADKIQGNNKIEDPKP